MRLPSKEAVGVRYTGWAALGRDPQEDTLQYTCPYCGEHGEKAARRTPDQYHFTDGFLQDLQGEMAACHSCRHSLRIAPVVLLHDQDEKRRFEGVFSDVWFRARTNFPVRSSNYKNGPPRELQGGPFLFLFGLLRLGAHPALLQQRVRFEVVFLKAFRTRSKA